MLGPTCHGCAQNEMLAHREDCADRLIWPPFHKHDVADNSTVRFVCSRQPHHELKLKARWKVLTGTASAYQSINKLGQRLRLASRAWPSISAVRRYQIAKCIRRQRPTAMWVLPDALHEASRKQLFCLMIACKQCIFRMQNVGSSNAFDAAFQLLPTSHIPPISRIPPHPLQPDPTPLPTQTDPTPRYPISQPDPELSILT